MNIACAEGRAPSRHVRGAPLRAAAALGLLLLVASGVTALASCAPPEPLPQRIARADAVLLGRVMSFEGGLQANARALVVQVLRVYKGSAPERVFISAGPGGEGGGAGPVATSVDYAAAQGTEHTFYLKQHAPAGFGTDACSGSHPGEPTAEERAALGDGRAPDRSPGGVGGASGMDAGIGAAVTLAALAAAYTSFRSALRH